MARGQRTRQASDGLTEFVATTPVQHNKVRTEEGGILRLTEAEAAPLLACGAVVPREPGSTDEAGDAPGP